MAKLASWLGSPQLDGGLGWFGLVGVAGAFFRAGFFETGLGSACFVVFSALGFPFNPALDQLAEPMNII